MDLISPNLKLPYLAPAQAQKHVTHNEALRQLDAVVQLSVLAITDELPAEPQNGECYILGSDLQNGLAGKTHHIAAFQDGAWAFLVPNIGWRAMCRMLLSFMFLTEQHGRLLQAAALQRRF